MPLIALAMCALLGACAPYKPVVTNGASGTDINNDRRADLLAVSRSNGTAAAPHGALLMPGGSLGLSAGNATGISTYSDGTWAARLGDVNNDGFADFMLGSDSGSGPYEVRVFLGGVATVSQQVAQLRSPRREDTNAGKSMGSAAWDINHDGFMDVVVVRRWRTVAVHFGSATGLAADPDQMLPLGDVDPIADVRGVGDIDGDGFAEVAFVHRVAERDIVRVHRGTTAGLETTAALEIVGVTGGVADRVDVNGDGRSDLVVGAIDGASGCVHTFAGGLATALSMRNRAASECASRLTGTFGPPRLLRAGDTNADGVEDILLFEPGLASECAGGAAVSFRVRLFKGTRSGLEPRDAVAIQGPSTTACTIGVDATAVGDVHGDGYADIVVGVPSAGASVAGVDGDGRLLVYRGGPEGLRADGVRIVDAPEGSGWGLGRFAR